MSNDTIARFTTYGPNRGLTLTIGAYYFIDGVCAVPASDAHAAASILCRYHDVCPAHELEEKSAEYDAAHGQPPASPPAPALPDTSDINLPPEGSDIVLVPAPLSQLVATPSSAAAEAADAANPPAEDAAPAGEAGAEAQANAAADAQTGDADDTRKEAEAKEAAKDAAKAPTPKKSHSK